MQRQAVNDIRREPDDEVILYIEEMLGELAEMARGRGADELAATLRMAALQASCAEARLPQPPVQAAAQ